MSGSPPARSAAVNRTDEKRPVTRDRTSRFIPSFKLAIRFFFPLAHPTHADPRIWRCAVHWFVPLGLVCGLLSTGWFSFIWWKFGEIERLRVLPSFGVVLLDVALIGYPMFKGTILMIQKLSAPPSSGLSQQQGDPFRVSLPVLLALVLLILLKFSLYLSIPTTPVWWPSDWRQNWMWLYPETVRRPILLAPIWGAWGILLASSIGRAAPDAPAALVEMGRAAKTAVPLCWFIPLAVLTSSYCSHHGNFAVGLILSFCILAITFTGSAAAARHLKGQSFVSILAAGQLAQLSFLTGFLAFGPYVFAS